MEVDSISLCQSYDVRMAEWSKALRSGRSPLLRAWVRIPLLTKIYFYFLKEPCSLNHTVPFKFAGSVPLAQRIARWTSNPKVLGSIPRWDDNFSLFGTTTLREYISSLIANVRMAEWSKAPDSR